MAKSDVSELFLKNIPVLQWSKHATAAEYSRLRPYVGANGWGSLTYQSWYPHDHFTCLKRHFASFHEPEHIFFGFSENLLPRRQTEISQKAETVIIRHTIHQLSGIHLK